MMSPDWLIYQPMENPWADVPRRLAANIENLRTRRGMSQGALARLAGIPRSTLTHLESGAGNPSLSNLARVAAALQVSIEELIASPRPAVKLIKAKDIPTVRRSQGMALVHKLSDPIPGMEIDRLELTPGGRMGGVPHVTGTKEYLTCISGRITVQVGGETHALSQGDVLAFPGDQAHSYQNPGSKPALGISVVVLAPTV